MPRIYKAMCETEIRDKLNVQEWGFNSAPDADRLVRFALRFSIANLVVEKDTLIIEFPDKVFSLRDIIQIAGLDADEMSVENENTLRLWWD